jgi:hypothetical protein
MKMNDDGQPMLTKAETEVTALRDQLHAAGVDRRESAREALDTMTGRVTKDFVEWLSLDTLTLEKGEVVEHDPEPANA